MSGGVDSSVTAALLVAQGYNVTGVYMKNWSDDLPGFHCPWEDDYRDALRVATQLGIELQMVDFREQYRDKVVDYLIEGYRQGLTPNPDIMCNQEIKFKLFLEVCQSRGADVIATGHYARTQSGTLLSARDTQKDQTYFLYRVSEVALKQTLFPLGDITKSDVRSIAQQHNLHVADKKDSQGICFIGDVSIETFLKQFITTEPGSIIDKTTGKVVGEHDGALFYTIGQRHGLGVGGGLPLYVVGKDMSKNEVYVTSDLHNEALWSDQLQLRAPHWINGPAQVQKDYMARIRHQGALLSCQLDVVDGDMTQVRLSDPVRAAAAGQSVVLYESAPTNGSDDGLWRVVGGGVIS